MHEKVKTATIKKMKNLPCYVKQKDGSVMMDVDQDYITSLYYDAERKEKPAVKSR